MVCGSYLSRAFWLITIFMTLFCTSYVSALAVYKATGTNAFPNQAPDPWLAYNVTLLSSTERKPIRDPHPLGISFEFFEFPAWMGLGNTAGCLATLEEALGAPPAIRMGGTTQDRGTFDPNLAEPIHYDTPPNTKVPKKLAFGPKYLHLASTLKGPITLGLNRLSDDLQNTVKAVTEAIKKIPNLYAVELGSQPEFYGSTDPIARKRPWNPQADVKSQVEWQASVSKAVNKPALIQAGGYLDKSKWSIKGLAPQEGQSAQYVKSFAGHTFQQSACQNQPSLPELMLHVNIARHVSGFTEEVAAAQKLNKPYHFSQANSANCGGGKNSATFGAALWLVAFTMQSLMLGVHRVYLHQGTIGQSLYNLWGNNRVNSPFYGAVFAARALRKATHMTLLNNGNFNHPVYAFYNGETLIQMLIYNSVYYDTPETIRPYSKTRIRGLPNSITTATGLRLSALAANSVQTDEEQPGMGNAYIDDDTCKFGVPIETQPMKALNGKMKAIVGNSEALLITFPAFDQVGVVTRPPAPNT